ncbi:MAG: hypothetical protein CVU39_22630 [Chloroflexi bacterium HGW-Chloroflexi-10]|nr:MAG: hypothetical protein CVU39_22630 [Chloroflexi bacterium HGW-Chloroflexi-10]
MGWAVLADLVRQPSSRVRSATIALLLEHPEYAEQMPAALSKLRSKNRTTLKLYYTAAVLLQRIYQKELKQYQNNRFIELPNLYGKELLPLAAPDSHEALIMLGRLHQELSGLQINWVGTYKNVLNHLLRRSVRLIQVQ